MPERIWLHEDLKENASLEEVLLFVIRAERETAILYRKMAKCSYTPLSKDKLENLAIEEDYHVEQLEKLYEYTFNRTVPFIEIDEESFNKKLVHDYTEAEALRLAIAIEDRAYDYYMKMAFFDDNPIAKSFLEYIAANEYAHKKALESELHFIKNEVDHDNPWGFDVIRERIEKEGL